MDCSIDGVSKEESVLVRMMADRWMPSRTESSETDVLPLARDYGHTLIAVVC
ncbi:MAG: hypothetical protein ACETVW_04360 [Dehalococcoidia bacterium]